MNGSIRLSSLILLGLLLLPRLVAADGLRLDLEFRTVENGASERPSHAQIWIDDRRVRIQMSKRGDLKPVPALIYRGDADTFLSLEPRTGQFIQIGRALINAMGTERIAARREVDGHAASLPKDQYKIIERYTGAKETGEPLALTPIRVIPKDETRTIAKRSCRVRELVRGEAVVGEICVVPWKSMGIEVKDLEVFRQFANFQRELLGARQLTPLELVPNQPFDILVQLDGFPLLFRNLAGDGVQSVVNVVRVDSWVADEAVFEAPADFTLRPGFSFLAGGPLLQSRAIPASPAP